ncbi:MAG TPA: hypothetical protein VKE53_07925 [Pseudolabrys sp.]|jgi:hypothetical protein|nr:hypothetical protein [Pseudolabrys sp.]
MMRILPIATAVIAFLSFEVCPVQVGEGPECAVISLGQASV